MKLPKDVLLKIAHLAHLKWVREHFQLELVSGVHEIQSMNWWMWDYAEMLVKKIWKKKLIEYDEWKRQDFWKKVEETELFSESDETI